MKKFIQKGWGDIMESVKLPAKVEGENKFTHGNPWQSYL